MKEPLPFGTRPLQVGMLINMVSVPSRWERFWWWVKHKLFRQPIPQPPPPRRIIAIDYEKRTITFGR